MLDSSWWAWGERGGEEAEADEIGRWGIVWKRLTDYILREVQYYYIVFTFLKRIVLAHR